MPTASSTSTTQGLSSKARALYLGLTLVLLGPAFGVPGHDSFPISSYPMFAADRGSKVQLYSVLGRDAAGAQLYLSPQLIAQTRWPNLAFTRVRTATRSKSAARGLCDEVAQRVAADADLSGRTQSLVVVRQSYDTRAYLSGVSEPITTRVFARCALPGGK